MVRFINVLVTIDVSAIFSRLGAKFRPMLLKVGELRSLMPANVNVMALTATATRSLRLELAKIIGMIKPTTVVLPPCKMNLSYEVSQYFSIEENFTPMLKKLSVMRMTYPCTIYCRRMEDCSDLYQFFESNLGKVLLSHLEHHHSQGLG